MFWEAFLGPGVPLKGRVTAMLYDSDWSPLSFEKHLQYTLMEVFSSSMIISTSTGHKSSLSVFDDDEN